MYELSDKILNILAIINPFLRRIYPADDPLLLGAAYLRLISLLSANHQRLILPTQLKGENRNNGLALLRCCCPIPTCPVGRSPANTLTDFRAGMGLKVDGWDGGR